MTDETPDWVLRYRAKRAELEPVWRESMRRAELVERARRSRISHMHQDYRRKKR